jgi:hypothetical protein
MTINRLNQDVTYLPAFRNLLINGAMQVAQRGTSTASITTAGYYTVDRYLFGVNSIGTWTMSQESDGPTGSGFSKSIKVLCTTADAAPAAADSLTIQHRIEGQNLQAIRKGTSSAQQLTASFWVKSNVTGTYVVDLFDGDNTRQVSASYSVSASATWEKKTITFPADTTGAFDNDNSDSLRMIFWLDAGTNFTSGTLNTTWASNTNTNRAVGQTNLAAATNNYWQITGVQLEVGAVATPFEFKPIEQELAECQRYYFRNNPTVAFGWLGSGIAASTTSTSIAVPLPSTMRATPSSVDFSNLSLVDSVNAKAVTTCTIDTNVSNAQFGVVTAGVASGLTQFRPYYIRQNSSSAGHIGFSAEL